MNRLILAFLLMAVIFTAACNRGGGDSEQPLPVTAIVNNPDNPNSVFLRITDKAESDTSVLYTVKGLFENDTVGFIVSLDQDIAPGVNEDGTVNDQGFHRGSVKFLRSGEDSDRFITALAHLWGVEDAAGPGFSQDPVQPLAFSSNKEAVDHDKASTNNFKLFFDPEADEPGEAFFTVDLYRRGIELQEKDAEYREMIIRALSGNLVKQDSAVATGL